MTSPDYTNTGGTGISIPSLLPSALGHTATAIASGVAVAGEPDPISVRRRWAVVVAINADSTVDIDLGGVLVPHVSYDASYHPALDEVVQVNVVDTDITVIGPTANSTYVSYVRRIGTITQVNRSASAPGHPTSVSVTLDDAQIPVSILNVPFVSEYVPTVGDSVMLGQGTNTNVYLVLGAVNRTWRRPTGDIEPTILSTAKPDTLIMQGQAVSRTTYAALWAWAQLNGLVVAGLFGTGDGSTTFTLPDFRGRTAIGAGALGSDTYALGATGGNARITLATNQMPAHTHSVSVAAHAAHNHGVSVATHGTHDHTIASGGSHGGHFPATTSYFAAAGDALGLASAIDSGAGVHNGHVHDSSPVSAGTHSVTETTGGPTTHSVTETTVGGTTQVDIRQPYIAVNWAIWT